MLFNNVIVYYYFMYIKDLIILNHNGWIISYYTDSSVETLLINSMSPCVVHLSIALLINKNQCITNNLIIYLDVILFLFVLNFLKSLGFH